MTSESARIEAWKRRLDGWEQYRNAKPNVGHYFVQALSLKEKLIGLITQNVDGLHSMAGVPDEKIVELHGSNRKILCMSCTKEFEPEPIINSLVGDFASPKCDSCGGILKAATVSFGQAMPEQAMRIAQGWTEQAKVFIVMGSSLQVQPAASFPVLAKRNGALLAIINREEGPLDGIADFVHHGAIGEFCGKFGEMIADG
jgi:NAD-dependent deacetylase